MSEKDYNKAYSDQTEKGIAAVLLDEVNKIVISSLFPAPAPRVQVKCKVSSKGRFCPRSELPRSGFGNLNQPVVIKIPKPYLSQFKSWIGRKIKLRATLSFLFFPHAGGNKRENSFLGCGDKPVFEPGVCASESGDTEKTIAHFLFGVRVCELKKKQQQQHTPDRLP